MGLILRSESLLLYHKDDNTCVDHINKYSTLSKSVFSTGVKFYRGGGKSVEVDTRDHGRSSALYRWCPTRPMRNLTASSFAAPNTQIATATTRFHAFTRFKTHRQSNPHTRNHYDAFLQVRNSSYTRAVTNTMHDTSVLAQRAQRRVLSTMIIWIVSLLTRNQFLQDARRARNHS